MDNTVMLSQPSVLVSRGARKDYVVNSDVTFPEIDVTVDDEAALNLYILADDKSVENRRFNIKLGRNSRLEIFMAAMDTKSHADSLGIDLTQPGAEVNVSGFALLDRDHSNSTDIVINHNASHCRSNQLVKYIVADRAQGSFTGLIRVAHGAHHTEAFQTNRNLLASPGARMHSEPQLEIYCDEVKCSHGSATGQLDERALFYMRSRGINIDTARNMLINAFLVDVIDGCPNPEIRETIYKKTRQRLGQTEDIIEL